MIDNAVMFMIPIVSVIAVFSFISVATWAESRRKEREAYYRNELLKKLADSTGDSARQVLELMREKELAVERRRREGLKLAGLIVAVVGLGLSVMLALLVPHEAVWSVGVIPLLIGLALMFHGYQTAPRTPAVESADRGSLS